jgi:hypothetical protein
MCGNDRVLGNFQLNGRILQMMVPRLVSLVALVTLACAATQRVVILPVEPTASALPSLSPSATPEPGTPEPTSTPTATPTPVFTCPNAPESRLHVGDKAVVASTKGPSLRLRRDPAVEDKNILKLIPAGTELTIIDGPVCASDPKTGVPFVFWQVSIPGETLKGWVAEGDAAEYFIEPLP